MCGENAVDEIGGGKHDQAIITRLYVHVGIGKWIKTEFTSITRLPLVIEVDNGRD